MLTHCINGDVTGSGSAGSRRWAITKPAMLAVVLLLIAMLATLGHGGVIDTNETSDDQEYYGVKIYPIERNCAMVGGICVHHTDCAEGTSTQGLCGNNRHQGVECCYSVVQRPATCQQLLGACMNGCNPALVRERATDCPEEQQCCLLVQ